MGILLIRFEVRRSRVVFGRFMLSTTKPACSNGLERMLFGFFSDSPPFSGWRQFVPVSVYVWKQNSVKAKEIFRQRPLSRLLQRRAATRPDAPNQPVASRRLAAVAAAAAVTYGHLAREERSSSRFELHSGGCGGSKLTSLTCLWQFCLSRRGKRRRQGERKSANTNSSNNDDDDDDNNNSSREKRQQCLHQRKNRGYNRFATRGPTLFYLIVFVPISSHVASRRVASPASSKQANDNFRDTEYPPEFRLKCRQSRKRLVHAASERTS